MTFFVQREVVETDVSPAEPVSKQIFGKALSCNQVNMTKASYSSCDRHMTVSSDYSPPPIPSPLPPPHHQLPTSDCREKKDTLKPSALELHRKSRLRSLLVQVGYTESASTSVKEHTRFHTDTQNISIRITPLLLSSTDNGFRSPEIFLKKKKRKRKGPEETKGTFWIRSFAIARGQFQLVGVLRLYQPLCGQF